MHPGGVFNAALTARETARKAGDKVPTQAELSAALTAAKTTDERAWSAEVSAVPLQQAMADSAGAALVANKDRLAQMPMPEMVELAAVVVGRPIQ